MTSEQDIALEAWIGRKEVRRDIATAVPVAALRATLDLDNTIPAVGDPIPELWHWLYFLPLYRQSEVGADGHAKRGGFLPPVPLPRRMWAGGRFRFLAPLRVGDEIQRTSTISNVTQKHGRTGHLVFVTVLHEIHGPRGLALTEEHDIVYRDMPGPDAPPSPPTLAPKDPTQSEIIQPDDVLLFRYSALTFNGHRIHYDRRYVTQVEGYPGLIVHGPLIATLLAGLASKANRGATMKEFQFRSYSPVFDVAPFRICSRPDADARSTTAWAETPEGHLAMQATAQFE